MLFSKKILVVDDDPEVLNTLKFNLKKAGYAIYVARNGMDAILIAEKEIPNLILLDISMPGMDGIEACKELRKNKKLYNTVIAFHTGRNENYSQKAGFQAGADDYIIKPVNADMLISRIAALLRRLDRNEEIEKQNLFGDIEINSDQYLIRKQGKKIDMPKKEFELLLLLTSKPGKVFTRLEILNVIWGHDPIHAHRTIDVHISRLRGKLGDETIKTVKGIGYKFEVR